jgi:steroid 5-alpha reductase family enzyme
MKIRENRPLSFAVIAVIYILASAIGIFVYLKLPYSLWLKLLIADTAATFFVFLCSLPLNNASVYDPYWSVQPIVILGSFLISGSVSYIKLLMFAAVLFWGVRLTANWAYTFKNLNWQDWRYCMLKEKSGKAFPLVSFFGIMLVPTLVVYGCVLPAVFLFNSEAEGSFASETFILLCFFAVILQGISDFEMQRYRRLKQSGAETSQFIRIGLWKYARHPNYLGEILMWWGIALASCFAMPGHWFLIAGAVSNTLMFLFISIPLADGRQAQKEGFAEYKAQTRMLFPIKHF